MPHDVRAVERKCLLEALAGALPEGAIRFNSRVTGLKTSSPTGTTQVQLQDGATFSAKVVIGYDGVNSTIGSWMGLANPETVGYCGIRGVAVYPDGHQLPPKTQYFLGKGVRTAYIPMSATQVYWFIVWNTWAQGWQTMTPEQIQSQAFQMSKSFSPPIIHQVISHTHLNHVWKSSIRQRFNKHYPDQTLVVSNITVAGDVCHPITPNMGQGGSMATEDAIVLARHLHGALEVAKGEQEEKLSLGERVNKALEGYQVEREARTSALAEQAFGLGRVMQNDWAVVGWVRDWLVVPWGLRKGTFLKHTLFDVGGLPKEV